MDWTNLVENSRVYDLSQTLEGGIPALPPHSPFRMVFANRHGDTVRQGGLSTASDLWIVSAHAGTHIDALGHISVEGKLHGGVDAASAQQGGRLQEHGTEKIPLLFCPGVLLDVAGYRGVDCLSPGEAITGEELQAVAEAEEVEIPRGGAILVRSGWGQYWDNPSAYVGPEGCPAPDSSAAEWIAAAGPRVSGHDTIAYECVAGGLASSGLPVHRILLAEHGIHLIENMYLEQLAADRVHRFLFVCLPLKAVGGTGSPVRPIAVTS